ncbi:hypothetical protein QQ994_19045 [Pseudomonas asiatica]|jgi:hypothetical protein|uniref:hypothetical protein n=1 Tax=Pseudomonas asiatica TaxID=2219225 RepID=UPI00257071BE|nr:hypothetical protein [Pseudomonas asiatica]WJD68707.1 hypothetical protein QQ994_19045 [Pseudomonas asiatica]HDS0929693.1 hypothetical protein [Pseudomonas putida]
MLHMKKAASPRTKLQKHNNQDTRVTVDSQDLRKEERQGGRLKRFREALEAFLLRQAILELWENRLEYWDKVCDFVNTIFEAFGS